MVKYYQLLQGRVFIFFSVLFLDSLDQLSDQDDGRSLRWLPTTLPKNVHIVVSTLRYTGRCLAVLKTKLRPERNANFYLEVRSLLNSRWLKVWMNNIKEEGNMIINFYFSHESEHARVSANCCQIKIGDFVSSARANKNYKNCSFRPGLSLPGNICLLFLQQSERLLMKFT